MRICVRVIGNHSDELTPWLPKIARRCGVGTRYFVIPCCFWDYTRRFTKKAHGQTRYTRYMYVCMYIRVTS